MTIGQFFKKYPNLEIEILLEHVLRKDKTYLFSHLHHPISQTENHRLNALIHRRLKGEPIAYLVGYKYFHNFKFKVSRATLIPRPETEQLVEMALEYVNNKPGPLKILDLGTGSGCVAISLMKMLNLQKGGVINKECTAVDISLAALRIAQYNAKLHKVKLNFVHSDLFKNVPGKYNLILANLPYVPYDYYTKAPDLSFEPKIALTDESNEGNIYKYFLNQAKNKLAPPACILLEIDPGLKDIIFEQCNFYLKPSKITFHKDLNQLIRFARIEL